MVFDVAKNTHRNPPLVAEAWSSGVVQEFPVMKVFNEREVSGVEEAGETAAGTPSPNYLRPFNVQGGRTVRIMAQYGF